MNVVLFIVAFIGIRFFNTISIKKAQHNNVSTISKAVIFIGVFSLIQGVMLLAMPPYKLTHIPLKFALIAVLYATFFILTYIFFLLSLNEGPASLTNAIFAFSTIVSVLAGVIIWNEKLNLQKIIGLALFIAALFVFNMSSYKVKDTKKKLSKKWVLLLFLATVFSGFSATTSRYAMTVMSNAQKEYLLIYNFAVVLVCIPVFIGKFKSVRNMFHKDFFKNSFIAALSQNLGNYLFLFQVAKFASSLFMPFIAALNMVVSIVAGVLYFKEKISYQAYIATGISLISIILLS